MAGGNIRSRVPEPGSTITRRAGVVSAAAALLSPGGTAAQDVPWPARPVRMVVPFVPGGGADTTARFVAQLLTPELGQSVVVDNKGGGGGTLGAVSALSAPADGYTLFYGTPGPLVTNPLLMANLPYQAARDFSPVSLLVRSAYVLVVHPEVPARSVSDLIALARARPGTLSYSSAGIGAGSHLAGALLGVEAGIDIAHVPYRGSAPSVQDVVAGQVPMTVDSLSLLIPLIRAGAVRALAVTAAERVPELPDVPAMAETLPGFEVTVFNCLVVRSGTPRPVVDRLCGALAKVLRSPEAAARYAGTGTVPVGSTPEELAAVLRDETAKWRRVIAQAGIRLD